MSIEKVMEQARENRERIEETSRAEAEVLRVEWAGKLADLLDRETWNALGIEPADAQFEKHEAPNIYQSLGQVLSVSGEIPAIEGMEGKPLRVRILMPMTDNFRGELMLSVAPVHGTFQATLWPPTIAAYSREGRYVGPAEKLEGAQSENIKKVGAVLLRFVESRDAKLAEDAEVERRAKESEGEEDG